MSRKIEVLAVAPGSPGEREFIAFPKRLYSGSSQWVPWFDVDMKALLRRRHPFFGQASGEFFLAREDGRTVARACVVKNPAYIGQHGTRCAHFYFFDADDDPEAVGILFDRVVEWTRGQGLEMLRGPMLLGGASGSGVLVQGYEHRAAMTMMPYNGTWYPRLLEGLGFRKHVDLLSMDLPPATFHIPERISSVADKVRARGRFAVMRFANKRALGAVADRIAELYNATLADHLEDYPLSPKELEQVKKDLLLIADPRLAKILSYDGQIVGYLFGFPDLSAVLQKNGGRTGPVEILRLLSGMRRGSDSLLINGMGILPHYQRLGGNALLYDELTRTAHECTYSRVELVQVSERTELMLRDIQTLGATISKVHRIYERPV
jgi:GNAT superfamily N-acetyltransferase